MNTLIETRLATLEQVSPDLLEVRFKPDLKLDVNGLAEILRERELLCPRGSVAVLGIFPPDIDFDLDVMTTDHYRDRGLENCTRALAIAAGSTMNERMAGLYFAYFPQPFNTSVFQTTEEARSWLAAQVALRPLS
jgi:hypothetical protein